jgi:DNA-binding transcriptional LysR family regulator
LDLIITDGGINKTPDLRALRSFMAVADIGGVTAAAGKLNLTRSAVSMQIKRL